MIKLTIARALNAARAANPAAWLVIHAITLVLCVTTIVLIVT